MTRLLLDTYTLIGVVSEPARLSPAARALLENSANVLFVSAITMWEVGVAVGKGRLSLPASASHPRDWFAKGIAAHSIQSIDMAWEIAAVATELPEIHADPADRFIIATAIVNDLTLITPDQTIQQYPGVKIAW